MTLPSGAVRNGDVLTLTSVADLSALDSVAALDELTAIELFACELVDLRPLARCEQLARLSIAGCTIASLEGIEGLPALETLDVHFSTCEDAGPIARSQTLRHLRSYGTPWSPESRGLLVELQGTEVPESIRYRIVEISDETEWRRNRAGWEQTRAFVSGSMPYRYFSLVRPGRELDYREVTPESVDQRISDGKLSFDSYVAQPALDRSARRFSCAHERGDRHDLAKWVRSNDWLDRDANVLAPDSLQEGMFNFDWRFSSVAFYRESESLFDDFAHPDRVALPRWYRTFRTKILAGIEPGRATFRARIDSFARPGLLTNGGWYTLGWVGFASGDDDRSLLVDGAGLYPIGRGSQQSHLFLHLSDPRDLRIYEARLADLHALKAPQRWPELALPVFDNLGQLHDAIRAVEFAGQTLDANIAPVEVG